MAALRSSSTPIKTLTPPPPPPPPSSFPLLRLPYTPCPFHPLRASKSFQKGAVVVIRDRRSWREIQSLGEEHDYETEEEEDEEDEDDDRSLDLLARFLHNVFRKVSRRARRAVRSVLPIPIPARLVGFSVNGVLILAFLWILKAFLEVVCTIGSMVFLSILLLRGMWFGFAYFQETRFNLGNRFDNDDDAWSGVQPAT